MQKQFSRKSNNDTETNIWINILVFYAAENEEKLLYLSFEMVLGFG